MAMYLGECPVYKITMIGRWSSDAFLRYIGKQVEQFSHKVSTRMLTFETHRHIPEPPRVSNLDPRQQAEVLVVICLAEFSCQHSLCSVECARCLRNQWQKHRFADRNLREGRILFRKDSKPKTFPCFQYDINCLWISPKQEASDFKSFCYVEADMISVESRDTVSTTYCGRTRYGLTSDMEREPFVIPSVIPECAPGSTLVGECSGTVSRCQVSRRKEVARRMF